MYWFISLHTCCCLARILRCSLLNDKKLCFSLIGLNSIFSTLPQSEYTSREVYSGLCLFLSIVYLVYSIVNKIGYNCFIIFQDYLNIKILKYDENFEILWNFWKFWNLIKILIFKKEIKFWHSEILAYFELFCNLIGRLEMKSRLWLDNVETPNRQ
jgi:hypothetical protein